MNIVGLPNFRNTCFFNASLQSLIYNEKLYEILQPHKTKNDLIKYFCLLQRICIQCEKVDKQTYVTLIKKLYQSLIKSSQFEPGQQEDASDCIGFLIDYFHESIKQEVVMRLKNSDSKPIKKESFKSWNKYYKDCYSPIIKYFYGQFGSALKCSNCKKGLNSFEPFNVLTLPITENDNNIKDALKTFCDVEELDDYKCDHCNEIHKYYKQTQFFILPYFLFIRLKNINRNNSRKQQIEMDPEIDLSRHFYHDNEIKYRLYAVIYHNGSLNNGHYYACRIFNNKYFLFDDTNIRRVNGLPDKNASVLCYERI
jgi:ubiquitin C-terminal hydrolase